MNPTRKDDDSPLSDDDLDTLPFLDELEEDTGGSALVRVTHERCADAAFDLALTITVAEMQKDEVPAAIEVPLATAIADLGDELRWQRVLVVFAGDALVPSAANRRVGELLADARALSVTVRRGYGDEVVHTGQRPQLELQQRPGAAPDSVHVDVAGAVDRADLTAALAAPLQALCADAGGKNLAFAFPADTPPDASTQTLLRDVLGAAGAARVTVATGGGEAEVVLDRALEAKAAIRASSQPGIDTEIDLSAGDDAAAALRLVLPGADLAGKTVRVELGGRAARPEEITELARAAARQEPRRVELTTGHGGVDVLWPPLLDASRLGKQTTLLVRTDGRDRAGVITAFARETAHLSEDLRGREVLVAWPADFAFDADVETACIGQALAPQQPARVVCSFGSDEAEPVLPLPLRFDTAAGTPTCTIDTDTGTPAELVRAIRRRVPAAGPRLAGQRLRLEIIGDGAVSRSMQRALRETLTEAGVTHASLHDHGTTLVLLPPLLAVERMGPKDLRIVVDAGERDAAEIESAAATELEAIELPGEATVRLRGTTESAIVAALVDRGAARILLDDAGGVQVHPPLFAPPTRDGDRLTLTATPGGDEAAVHRQLEHELPAILATQGDIGDVEVTVHWAAAALPDRAIELLIGAQPAALMHVDDSGATTLLYPEPDELEAIEPEPEEPELELEELEEPQAPPVVAAARDDELDFSEALFDDPSEFAPPAAAPPAPAEPAAPEPPPAAAEPAAAPRAAVTVLARKTDSEPPMTLLGIEWSSDADAITAVERELAEMRDEVAGHRTLVVFQQGGRPFGPPDRQPLVVAVRRALSPASAALLLFREPRSLGGVAHFQVVASRLEGLAVGTRMKDPRRRG